MIDRRHSRLNEAKMLDWLRECADRDVIGPSYAEIAARFDFDNEMLAKTLVAQLSDAGLIRIRPAGADRFQFELTDRPRKQFTRNAFVRRQEETKKPSARVQTIRQIAEGLAKRNEPAPAAPTAAPRIGFTPPPEKRNPGRMERAVSPAPRVAPAGKGPTPSPKVDTKPTDFDRLKAGLPAMEVAAHDDVPSADMGNPIAVEMPGAAPAVVVEKRPSRPATRQVNMHIPIELYDQIVKLRGPGEAGAAPTAVRLIRQAIEGIPAAVDASPEPEPATPAPDVDADAMSHFVAAMQSAKKFLAALEREGIKL